ncbi:helix-turn-helix domain-containing protein [Sphingomonas sp. 3-13AW]|jgi:transcriptional regulator with XRE-family HTH domain|uniref:helix-turn-helix domain-containing protein n=1 Tax=Sphingomonas sp. 3-13AW TaxID=3050450 RepID=UPI003BB79AA2
MITAIREVRRAKGLTLEEVAQRCRPATTAQTIGRLETGTRTVSIGWLNRIAEALEVDTADLVKLPDRPDVAVAAILDGSGATAPRRPATVAAPRVDPNLVAVTVSGGVGDYRAGDEIWCARLMPEAFGKAMNRDVLVPRSAGRFVFGRLLARDGGKLHLLPPGAGNRQQVVPEPAWLAMAVRLVRTL